jgi:hypothetical protein
MFLENFVSIQKQLEQDIRTQIGPILGPTLETIVTKIVEGATHLGKVFYGDELKGIAQRSGLKLGRIVLLQLVYEASTCCTSIVVPGPNNIPIHMFEPSN